MKPKFLFYVIGMIAGAHTAARGASLLTAQKFGPTINDVSLTDRMVNLEAGYEPFKDAQAYASIELQSVNEALAEQVKIMEQEHELYCMGAGAGKPECIPEPTAQQIAENQIPTENNTTATQNNATTTATNNTAGATANNTGNATNAAGVATTATPGGYCSQRHPEIPNGQKMPLGVPLSPQIDKYAKHRQGIADAPFGVYRGIIKKTGKQHYHEGVDLALGERYFGNPVYAIADGIIRYVVPASDCKSSGNAISITHEGGYISSYMHLNSMLLKPSDKGMAVKAGCIIGYEGHTGGNATQSCPKMGKNMTHLHYELRHPKKPASVTLPNGQVVKMDYRGTAFNPTEFLKYKY